MTDKLSLGIDFDLGSGEELLAAFEKKLGTVIDRSKGLEHALIETSKAAADKAGKMKALKAALDEAVTGANAQAKAEKDAAAALKETEKATKAATDALKDNTAKVTEIFRKGIGGGEMVEKVRDIEKGYELWGNKTLTLQQRQEALAGAIGIGARLVTGYLGQIIAFARAVDSANTATRTQQEQLQLLGPAYATMNAAAQGTLTTQTALSLRNELQANGLRLTTEQLGVATRAARDFSQVNGVELSAATAVVTTALNGDSAAMQRLGISAGNSTEALRRLAEQQSRSAVIGRSAEEQIAVEAAHLERLKNATLGAAGAVLGMNGALGTMHDAFTIWDADWTSLDSVNRALRASYPQVREAAVAAAAAAARGAHDAAEGAEKVRSGTLAAETQFKTNTVAVNAYSRSLEDLRKASEAAGRASTDLSAALQPGETAAQQMQRQVQAVLLNAGRASANRQHAVALRQAVIDAGGSASAADLGMGVSHGGGENVAQLRQQLARAQEDARRTEGGQVIGGARSSEFVRNRNGRGFHQQEEAEATFLHRMLDMQRAANAAHLAELTSVHDAETTEDTQHASESAALAVSIRNENNERRRTDLEAFRIHQQAERDELTRTMNARRAAASYSTQISAGMRTMMHGDVTSAQSASQALTGVMQSMGSAAEQHVAALIEGNESGTEAMRAFTHTMLMQIGMQAGKESIFETAKGIAAVARAVGSYGGDFGAEASAPMHFAAAGVYAGIAGIGFAGAAATNAPKTSTGTGSAPSAAASLGRGPANDNAGGGGNVVYNFRIDGSVVELDRAVGGAMDRLRNGRNRPAAMRHAA